MKFRVTLILSTLVAASLVACGPRSTDEEQVRALIAEAETAAEARDTGDVLARVADDYSDSNGFDKSRLRDFLRAWFVMNPDVELIVNIEKLEFPADGLARSEISVTRVSLANPERLRLRVEFRRSDGAWQVSRADRLVD